MSDSALKIQPAPAKITPPDGGYILQVSPIPASTKSENLSEGVDHAVETVAGTMGAYLNTLSRFKS